MTPQAPTREMTMRVGLIQWTARGALGEPELSRGSTTRTPASASTAIAARISEPSSECMPVPKWRVSSRASAEEPSAVAQAKRARWTLLGHHRASTPHPTTTRIADAAIRAVNANPHTEG